MKLARDKKAGVKIWGPVWSMGATKHVDRIHGPYFQFVIKVPRSWAEARTEGIIWIQWFEPIFEPEPKQWLSCAGIFSGAAIQTRVGKPPKMNVTFVCFGEDVTRLKTPEEPIKFERKHAYKRVGPAKSKFPDKTWIKVSGTDEPPHTPL